MTVDTHRSLAHHRDFRWLWSGDALGQLGAQFTMVALPVLAVSVLDATEWEMGLLTAATTAAFLVIGLPTGAWVDRMRKRRVLIVSDLVRAAVLAAVAVVSMIGHASMPILYAGALAISAASVFFDVAHQSYVPGLVGMEQVVEGNAKLQATASVAQVAGPAGAGQLLRFWSAPLVIGLNAVAYLVSAVLVARIRQVEVLRPRAERRPLGHEIREGLSFVFHQPLLVRMVACTSIGNLGGGILGAVETIYVLRTLGLDVATLGVILSGASIGGLLGALAAERLSRRIGEARIIPLAAAGMGLAVACVPLAGVLPIPPQVTLIAGLALLYFVMVVYNVAAVSFRQRLCPPHLLGRMNASVRFIVWGTTPLGGLLGGALGEWAGITPTLWVAFGVMLGAALPVLTSPLLRMSGLPTAGVDPAVPGSDTGRPGEVVPAAPR